MWPFLVAISAILAWAYTQTKGGGASAETKVLLKDALGRLDAAEAERQRLVKRVENLEAIVTSDEFELEREARRALPSLGQELAEGGGRPPLALDESEGTDDEARAANLARRVRER